MIFRSDQISRGGAGTRSSQQQAPMTLNDASSSLNCLRIRVIIADGLKVGITPNREHQKCSQSWRPALLFPLPKR